ncbi:MAG: hypothetical protein M0042_10970 [Nitrospiraceae bacterium]|nr:hypothetical protein [Nitrospiraceae bacterium]
MPQLVPVSSVESLEKLKTYINELFEKGKYEELSQAIGMHSILIDPEHTIGDQNELYGLALNLIKNRVRKEIPAVYASWLTSFPALLSGLVSRKEIIADEASQTVLASYHDAYGHFTSLDAFYAWALDDRRLTLGKIVQYIMKTVELKRS